MKKSYTLKFSAICLSIAMSSVSALALEENEIEISSSFVQGNYKYIGTYFIKPVHSDKCLDVKGFSQDNTGNIHQWQCTAGTNQRWNLYQNGDKYKIQAYHSDKIMDASARHNEANVYQYADWDGNNQKWYIEPKKYGSFQIVSVADGRCLDIQGFGHKNGTNLFMYDCFGGPNQRFHIENFYNGNPFVK